MMPSTYHPDYSRVMEEGANYDRQQHRARFRRAVACRCLVLCVLAGLGASVFVARDMWNSETDNMLERLRAAAHKHNVSCVTTRHVNETALNWVLFVGETPHRLMANLQVVHLSGEQFRAREEATHCDSPTFHATKRFYAAQISYEVPSFDDAILRRRASEFVTGGMAVCAQHAVDVFMGRVQCARTIEHGKVDPAPVKSDL
jgi:hypothetical protein